MKGKVLSLHDGFHLDVTQGAPIPPKAIVQFDSGMALVVDRKEKLWGQPKTSKAALLVHEY